MLLDFVWVKVVLLTLSFEWKTHRLRLRQHYHTFIWAKNIFVFAKISLLWDGLHWNIFAWMKEKRLWIKISLKNTFSPLSREETFFFTQTKKFSTPCIINKQLKDDLNIKISRKSRFQAKNTHVIITTTITYHTF